MTVGRGGEFDLAAFVQRTVTRNDALHGIADDFNQHTPVILVKAASLVHQLTNAYIVLINADPHPS